MVNADFEFKVPDCSVDSQRDGSSVSVQSLIPITDTHSPSDELGFVRDFRLSFFPERTTEAFTVKCGDSPTYTSGPSGLWWSVCLVLHQNEIQQGSGEEGAALPAPDIASIENTMSGFAIPILPKTMVAVSPSGEMMESITIADINNVFLRLKAKSWKWITFTVKYSIHSAQLPPTVGLPGLGRSNNVVAREGETFL